MNTPIAISRSQSVASTICSSRMNQAYLAITTTSRYATSNKSQIRSAGFSSIRDGRYLMFGLSRMEFAPPEGSLSQMEVADDQNSEQRKAARRNHPPLRLAPSVLEWI